MALFHAESFSVALKKLVHYEVLLPNDLPPFMKMGNPNYQRPMKLLILLHGFNGTQTDWLYGTNINELAGKYNLCIVTPCGDNSFYLNDEAGFYNYCTFVGEELVNYVRSTFGLSCAREDTLIGGYSMGGFGAIHTAASYPETFSKLFALSSAMIIEEVSQMKPGQANAVCDYDGYVRIFGPLEKLAESDNNPRVLLKRLKEQGARIPAMYLACGTEDMLIRENHALCEFLDETEIPYEYHESHGIHNWTFWQSYLEPALQWMLELKEDETKDNIHLVAETE